MSQAVRAHRVLWTALKPQRICAEGQIGIAGEIFDVRAFAKEHPGGEVWLRVSEGLDVTNLFESSHLNMEAVRARLKTLTVCGHYDTPSNDRFASYRHLRAAALATLPTRASRRMDVMGSLQLSAWTAAALGTHAWLLCAQCFTLPWVMASIAAAVANTVCGGFGHDALHRLSPAAALLDWNGLSSFEWIFEHVLSHHPHVNSPSDHDALSFEPFLRWLPNRPAAMWGDAQTSPFKHLLYFIAEIVVPIQGLFVHRLRWSAARFGAPKWMVVAPLLFLIRGASLVGFHGLRDGLLTLVLTLMMAGYYFAFLAHESHKNISDTSLDFVMQQLSNTRDIHAINGSLGLFLDRQRLHHLFPTVCHLQLPRLKRGLRHAASNNQWRHRKTP